MLTKEDLDDLIADSLFTIERVGAPGCKVKQRAERVLRLIEFYEKAQSTARSGDGG